MSDLTIKSISTSFFSLPACILTTTMATTTCDANKKGIFEGIYFVAMAGKSVFLI